MTRRPEIIERDARMLARKAEGQTVKQIAVEFSVSIATVYQAFSVAGVRAARARGETTRAERRVFLYGPFRGYSAEQMWTPEDQYRQFVRERSCGR